LHAPVRDCENQKMRHEGCGKEGLNEPIGFVCV